MTTSTSRLFRQGRQPVLAGDAHRRADDLAGGDAPTLPGELVAARAARATPLRMPKRTSACSNGLEMAGRKAVALRQNLRRDRRRARVQRDVHHRGDGEQRNDGTRRIMTPKKPPPSGSKPRACFSPAVRRPLRRRSSRKPPPLRRVTSSSSTSTRDTRVTGAKRRAARCACPAQRGRAHRPGSPEGPSPRRDNRNRWCRGS